MESINRLKQMRAQIVRELEENANSEKFSRSLDKKLTDSINDIDNQIKAVEDSRAKALRYANPEQMSNAEHEEATYGFKSFGDWLKTVKSAGVTRMVDDRLTKFPSGMGETDPSGGGFAIPPQFFNEIITKTYEEGKVASEVFRIPVGDSNGISLPLIDETSRATGARWGGVSSQWVSEASTVSYTAPKYRLLDLKLNKLMSLWAVTDELMQDAPAVSAIAERAFGLELTWMIEDGIINGSGVGCPQGIQNSPATYVYDRANANEIGYADVAGMMAHIWPGSDKNYKWYASQTILPQLLEMTIGSSSPFPMFVIPGGMNEEPKVMLFGKEIKYIEQAQALGTQGDLTLADLSQYVLIDKASPQFQSSIHVLFLSDQMAFRTTYRANGSSLWRTQLTPAYGGSDWNMSPFITLGAPA